MLTTIYITIGIFLFILGASIYSFLNVVIYRLPRHMNMVNDRSICPTCGHQLHALDLIPLFSWIFLGAKCRYCHTPISKRYPMIETLGGLFALLCTYFQGLTPQALLTFALTCILTCIAMIDHDTMEIPNGLILWLCAVALLTLICFPEITIWSRLIGMICISVPLLLITLLIPGAFGGGDIKMMIPMGFYLGWKLCCFSFAIAVLTGGLYGIYLLAAKKKDKKDHFAFGPFLCIGVIVAIFCGNGIIEWYIGLL